jgi:hypothetical protein
VEQAISAGREQQSNAVRPVAQDNAASELGGRGSAGSLRSAEIHDDHAAVRVVLFRLRGTAPSRIAIKRKLETRLVLLPPLAFLLLALPNLLDDERRKHQVLPLHSIALGLALLVRSRGTQRERGSDAAEMAVEVPLIAR